MKRELFIKQISCLCVGAGAIGTLLEGCASTVYVACTTSSAGKLILKKSEFNIPDKENKQRKFVMIRDPQFSFPIVVYKIDEGKYSALLIECTHKSCELIPNAHALVCPCHASEFNTEGKVINPPAEQNLKSFPTETDHENIYIKI